jgi:hypothetical protein
MDAFFGCNMFTAQLAAAAAATADVGAAVDAATKPAVAAAGEHEAVPRETGKDADWQSNLAIKSVKTSSDFISPRWHQSPTITPQTSQ